MIPIVKYQSHYKFNSSVIKDVGPAQGLKTLPEDEFFDHLTQGEEMGTIVPLPSTVSYWRYGEIDSEPMLYAHANTDLYMLINDTKNGYVLAHYVSTKEGNGAYHAAFQMPLKIIESDRSVRFMTALEKLAAQSSLYQNSGNNGNSLQSMSLGGQNNGGQQAGGFQQAGFTAPMGEGVRSNYVDPKKLVATVQAYGYVAGYVMKSAPKTSFSFCVRRTKASVTSSIQAKQTKPSGFLSVMMALPSGCVMRGGSLASPDDILNCNVDFDPNKTDLIYQAFPMDAAIAYISSVGEHLPEYAPFAAPASAKQKTHWAPQDILNSDPKVTYVALRPIEIKNSQSSTARFHFVLRSTSPRRGLFTQRNVLCLSALEHTTLRPTTAKEAYDLNNTAFADWRYLHPRNSSGTSLERAELECPQYIWGKTYDIDGKQVEGIGSAYIMVGGSDTNAGGEIITAMQASCIPWYATGELKTSPENVETIVARKEKRTEDRIRWVSQPILLKEDRNNAAFKWMMPFMEFITATHNFITVERLMGLGARTPSSTKKSAALTNAQRNSLQAYMHDTSVRDAIAQVQNSVASQTVLSGQ